MYMIKPTPVCWSMRITQKSRFIYTSASRIHMTQKTRTAWKCAGVKNPTEAMIEERWEALHIFRKGERERSVVIKGERNCKLPWERAQCAYPIHHVYTDSDAPLTSFSLRNIEEGQNSSPTEIWRGPTRPTRSQWLVGWWLKISRHNRPAPALRESNEVKLSGRWSYLASC